MSTIGLLPTLPINASGQDIKNAGFVADSQNNGVSFWYYAHAGDSPTYCFFYGRNRCYFSLNSGQTVLYTNNGAGSGTDAVNATRVLTFNNENYTVYCNERDIGGRYFDGISSGLLFDSLMEGYRYYYDIGVIGTVKKWTIKYIPINCSLTGTTSITENTQVNVTISPYPQATLVGSTVYYSGGRIESTLTNNTLTFTTPAFPT